jgi:hypothetical protein
MLIAIPKKTVEMQNELRRILTAEIWDFANNRGVKLTFLHDSKDIIESIDTIASRTVYLIENTKLDTLLLASMKDFQKGIDNAEKKKVKK